MALYDDYFTHADKPFVENLNDALLLSNVFDMTVQVDAPEMFSNSTWVNTTSPRKCSVSVLQLKEALPSGVSVSTSNNKSVLTGTGTVKLGWYPNFNAFGKYRSISWTGTGTIKVNLKTTNGTTIANDIANGTITSESVELRKLQEIVIEIVLTNATLTGLSVVMGNKQSTRYGATVGITDVTGLSDSLASKVSVSDIKDNLTSTDANKPLSANQGKALKTLVDGKSDSNHNHDDRYFTETEISGWVNFNPTNPYVTISINEALRLFMFRYYRPNYEFTTTNEISLGSVVNSGFTPVMNTILSSYNATIIGAVLTDGELTVQTTSTGTKTINLTGMWHY